YCRDRRWDENSVFAGSLSRYRHQSSTGSKKCCGYNKIRNFNACRDGDTGSYGSSDDRNVVAVVPAPTACSGRGTLILAVVDVGGPAPSPQPQPHLSCTRQR